MGTCESVKWGAVLETSEYCPASVFGACSGLTQKSPLGLGAKESIRQLNCNNLPEVLTVWSLK